MAASKNLTLVDKLFQLKVQDNNYINILLLGETGVGKSTFINALTTYLTYKDPSKALKSDLVFVIPSVINIVDKNSETKTIKIGYDVNEVQAVGESATQNVKTYVFPLNDEQYSNKYLRFIDCPGMGDVRGIEKDNENCDNILLSIEQLKELHAICILLKPTTTRMTAIFEYCLKEILSRLEKSASNNIIFIFTNTRGTNYTPGETLPCLKKIIDQLKNYPPNVEIPFYYEKSPKNNIFCLDNEAFRFLLAQKHNIMLNEKSKRSFNESWQHSYKECWRIIKYIIGDGNIKGRIPHQIRDTISINEARRFINYLTKPLTEINNLIFSNIRLLKRHHASLNESNQTLDELKKKLYIPIYDLKIKNLSEPVTVCTSTKCARIIKAGNINKWHYEQKCHNPCYLYNVPKEIVGDVSLIKCKAMNNTETCTICKCNYSVHMHIYYETEQVEKNDEDINVKRNIKVEQDALKEKKKLIEDINKRKTQLNKECETIQLILAQFTHFLQNNAITPFNDAYEKYINYLIEREKHLGSHSDIDQINNYQDLLKEYQEKKKAFDESLKLQKQLPPNSIASVTPYTIIKSIEDLYKLPINGNKIRELMQVQMNTRNNEYEKTCEYVHPKKVSNHTANNNNNNNDKNKNINNMRYRNKNTPQSQNKNEKQFNNQNYNNCNHQRQQNQQNKQNNKSVFSRMYKTSPQTTSAPPTSQAPKASQAPTPPQATPPPPPPPLLPYSPTYDEVNNMYPQQYPPSYPPIPPPHYGVPQYGPIRYGPPQYGLLPYELSPYGQPQRLLPYEPPPLRLPQCGPTSYYPQNLPRNNIIKYENCKFFPSNNPSENNPNENNKNKDNNDNDNNDNNNNNNNNNKNQRRHNRRGKKSFQSNRNPKEDVF